MNRLFRNGNDFLLGVVMLALSAFLLISPDVAKEQIMANMGGFFARADVYIKMLAFILLILSVILILKSINFKKSEDVKPLNIKITREVSLSAAALVLYVLLLPVAGFIPTSFIFVVFLVLLYMRKENEDSENYNDRKAFVKRIGFAVVYATVLVAALCFTFTELLGSVLP